MKRWQLLVTSGLVMALLAGAMPSLAWSQGRGQGFRPCPYKPYSCPLKALCKPFDESGQVVQVLSETLEEGMHPGMAVVIDTKTRGQVIVNLGPVWYLERQEFEIKPGDVVRVKGMCEKQKDGRLRVIAYALTKGNFVLQLRDSQGRPNWEAWRKMGD
jgi:hypothetical protein